MTRDEPKALLALLFTVLIWGVTPVLVRNISMMLGGWDALLIRLGLSSLLFVILLAFTTGFAVSRQHVPRLVAVSLLGVLGYYAFSIFGFAIAPAGVGTLIMSTQPMIIALLARLVGTEELRPATIVGIIIAFAGSVILVSGDAFSTSTSGSSILTGCVFLFLAGVGWSLFVVFSKPLIQTYGALKITGLANIISTLPLIPFINADTISTLAGLNQRAMIELGLLIVMGHAASVVSWNYAAGHLRPTLLGMALYVVPLLAIISGWALLNEEVTLRILLAAAVILAGVFVSQWSRKPRGSIQQATGKNAAPPVEYGS